MALQRYGFIVKSADLDMFKHQGQIASEHFNMSVSGVRDVSEAILVAQEMLTRRVQLIELCGGFSTEEAQQIRDGINDHIPVGVVQYSPEERERLASELA
ncbi:DUF6506 family protein [Motiliproteus sp. MSK22-1]|uniref:DUF6506 family protein n=1 Tax=Motiliproteus sp. MSK22-1 TaxID=1897630 RepID=UPI000975A523|nr:DUF6506 family protein [Motiliproteus sp. MSK22-1]OMH30788.1 hypothetical protein BGP75_17330 [Motiliproteus sp. MSK22-1]